jgi:hypothetical protein
MRYLPANELAARPCIVVDGAPRAEALITGAAFGLLIALQLSRSRTPVPA